MQTEFQKLSLDRVRYSIVWEDHQTLYQSLDIQPEDQVLVITSAGDNVLNAVLKGPQSVTAIDLNPIQNALLELKCHVIKNQPYPVYADLLGLRGQDRVMPAWATVAPALPEEVREYWEQYFKIHPEGIMESGKLESYLTQFLRTLPKKLQSSFEGLLACEDVESQAKYFEEKVNTPEFKSLFIDYVDRQNLAKARDPRLFKYAGDNTGLTFYKRLVSQSQSMLWRDNFHWRFFFYGAADLPQDILPPCYQEVNYKALKSQIDRIQMVEGEALDYLLSPEGATISKASLSNVFEYTGPIQFNSAIQKLMEREGADLTLVYWNLLQEQRLDMAALDVMSTHQRAQESCFYFGEVCALQLAQQPSLKSQP